MGVLNRTRRWLNHSLDGLPGNADDKLRLKHFSVFVICGVPALVAFGVMSLIEGDLPISGVIFLNVICLLSSLFFLRRVEHHIIVYRVCGLCFAGLLIYVLIVGGEGGSKILWIYIFPLITFFLLGKIEGLVWSVSMIAAILMLVAFAPANLGVYPYPSAFITRFIASYAIICAVSYWYEHFRADYRHRLQDETRRFAEILEYSRDILYRRDLQTGRYDYISAAFGDHLGYSQDEVANMEYDGIEALIHPDDRGLHDAAIAKILANHANRSQDHLVEYRMRCKDGAYLWFSDQIIVILDDAGQPAHVLGSNREITDQRNMRLALQEARDQLVTILNSIDAHIYVADMDSHRILFMNNRMKDDFGRNMEGEICWKAFREESGPCHHCSNARLLDKENRPTGSVEWECHNPITGRWYNNYDRAIQWGDGKWVRIQIAVDITRIKEMEAERQQNEAALRRARQLEAIGTLAGGIAHDFNNLLQIIMGNLSLAVNHNAFDDAFFHYMDAVKAALDKARNLANRLVTFSTGGAPHKVAVKVMPLLEQLANEMVHGTSITTEIDMAKDLWLTPIDYGQMRLVFKNVIENAREGMGAAGRLAIAARNVTISKEKERTTGSIPEGRYVEIAVQDNGRGIPQAALARVLEPYYTTKKQGAAKGTGMGLSIAYSIIKRHDGHLVVSSHAGQGTTVRIYLPAEADEGALREQQPQPRASKVQSEDHRVLLMDDERMIRTLARDMFTTLGYDVDTARDGQEAIARYETMLDKGSRYFLVILDLTVNNGMGGRQAMEALTRMDHGVRAVVSSGYSSDPVMTDYRSHGFSGALAKPYSVEQVRNLLDQFSQS